MFRKITKSSFIAFLFFSISLHAQTATQKTGKAEPLHFFSGLWSNFGDTLWAWNWAYYGAAFAGSGVMVNSGLDERVNTHYQKNNRENNPFSRPTQIAFLNWGNFAQAVPHTALFFYGYFWGHNKLAAAGAAGLQAMGISGGMVLTLKWATGRPRPVYDGNLGITPRDKEFDFNVMRQSIDSDRWRWPSGHTSSSFTAAAAFAGFYSDEPWVAFVAYPIATLMGYAMIVGQYHWASDVWAGALIGHAVGWTVGKNFRKMYEERKSNESYATILKEKPLQYTLAPYSPPGGGGGISVIAFF